MASLTGGEDWLLRPVMRGILRAESLRDGTVDLEYVDLLNEAIDVEMINRAALRPEQPHG